MEFDSAKMEKSFETLTERVESIQEKKEGLDQRRKGIEDALEALEQDISLKNSLKVNEAQLENEQEQLESETTDAKASLKAIQEQLEQLEEKNNNAAATLEKLRQIGEHTEEGDSIIADRRTWLEECYRRVKELADKLGENYEKIGKFVPASEHGRLQDKEVKPIELIEEKKNFIPSESIVDSTAFPSDTFGQNLQLIQDRLSSSRYFSRGNHYNEYLEFWEQGNYCFLPEKQMNLVYIRARDIEGVYLNDREVQNPESFWTRNGRNGWSRENILRKAAHIEDIQKYMRRGASLEDLSQNPVLNSTIQSYYNNPVRVARVNGYYVFQSDGRHRTLAAQSLDVYIPVLITGSYVKNLEMGMS